MREVEPGKYLVNTRRGKYLVNRRTFIVYTTSQVLLAMYVFVSLIAFLLQANVAVMLESMVVLLPLYLFVNFSIFRSLTPLSPQEAGKYIQREERQ